jgi:UDP-glucose 4-epimerase
MSSMNENDPRSDDYRGVTVLVLGASGFIGRWVARELCRHGANVHLVVRDKNIGKEVFVAYDIQGEVIEMDLRNPDLLADLFQQVRPSITFNLAGYGVDPTERDDEAAYQTNTEMVAAICSAMAEVKDVNWAGQDLVHAGSALEYGTVAGDLSEDSIPNPTTAYGKSKLAGTIQFARCCDELRLKGLTARLFTVFGPGEHDGRLLPSLLEAATAGSPVLLTSGVQERDFTYVGDVADGLLRLGLNTTAKPGEVVNLATGQLTSVRSFAETAAHILDLPQDRLRFGAKPTRTEEMKHSAVTVARLQQLTSWRPTTTVDDGITETLRFFQRHSIAMMQPQ